VFLLYSNLQTSSASGSGSSLGSFRGLGHVDSRRDSLAVKFELTPPTRYIHLDTSNVLPSPNGRNKKSGTSKRARKGGGEKTVEIKLAQDTTALRSRKGDTGSVLWKAR
jgi:hypothetical protein